VLITRAHSNYAPNTASQLYQSYSSLCISTTSYETTRSGYSYSTTSIGSTYTYVTSSYTTDYTTTSSDSAYAIQVRWASSDLCSLETDPLNFGQKPTGCNNSTGGGSTSSPSSGGSGGLSTGAKIGIGLGVGIVGLIALGAIGFFFIWRAHERKKQRELGSDPSQHQPSPYQPSPNQPVAQMPHYQQQPMHPMPIANEPERYDSAYHGAYAPGKYLHETIARPHGTNV
jgi:hypothetical protein